MPCPCRSGHPRKIPVSWKRIMEQGMSPSRKGNGIMSVGRNTGPVMFDPGLPEDPGQGKAGGVLETLEQRIRRLEDAVAELQDPGQLEERTVHRVGGSM